MVKNLKLYRLRLRPLSPWMTPWQSDTLSGLLCWMGVRTGGVEKLKEIIEPAYKKKPRFVLSDVFPGDLLPLPTLTRIQTWPPEERKRIKKSRWLSQSAFSEYRKDNRHLKIDEVHLDPSPFCARTRLRTMLDRTRDTTGEDGSLFSTLDTSLTSPEKQQFLSVYARIESGFEDELLQLFKELSKTGYGADISSGFGEFEVLGTWEDASVIDEQVTQPNGLICLSSFQPDTNDPTDGLWECFVKYGKLGPDFGIENVFKRPQLLFKPGACFHSTDARPYIGRVIPMKELLSPDTCAELRARETNIVHYAYGLTVSAQLPWNKFS